MARLKDLAESTRDGFNIDPRKIEIEPGFNARDFTLPENAEHIANLEISIESQGVLEPLTVQLVGEHIYLRDGECRLRAVTNLIGRGLEIKSVPCMSEDRNAGEAERVARMVVRNTGKQLTALEQAEAYRRLVGYGWEVPDIAKKCGYSRGHVENCLTLGAAPHEVTSLVKAGKVSAATARASLRQDGEQAAPRLREAVATAERQGRKKAAPKDVAAVSGRAHLTRGMADDLLATLQDIAMGADDPHEIARVCLARHGIGQKKAA